jgi:hypothetical protein
MKSLKVVSVLYVAIAIAASLGCSDRSKAPDVSNDIRHALDEGGLNDVSVSQDRDKGVATVVSNEIGVRPNGDEGTAKKVDSALDSGIDKNLDAI